MLLRNLTEFGAVSPWDEQQQFQAKLAPHTQGNVYSLYSLIIVLPSVGKLEIGFIKMKYFQFCFQLHLSKTQNLKVPVLGSSSLV